MTCLVLVALLKVDVDVILFDGGRHSIRVYDCHLLSTGSSTAKDIAKLPISPICDRRHFRENNRMVATATVHEALKLIL